MTELDFLKTIIVDYGKQMVQIDGNEDASARYWQLVCLHIILDELHERIKVLEGADDVRANRSSEYSEENFVIWSSIR